ncbi:hypothetical protein K493DRAFT_294001 [Basidiobolus meristosporus CBS 931.73]|uniref:protein-tyrosine-phosphatase n=1 Tax=Basidiobolus meristosporus CBS 931.73 TaxID=1314790 RepID=A0A1Y1WSS5_9FUNG|nr:hypothetical protein K493DRAFT_294001 [Basidiobolus meristosporus CBS 931.73]|eukprot:ORX76502.1 hypothetical protein K493DRAFT_294001 [Basidiobolus meristosporus CBS 931.73]
MQPSKAKSAEKAASASANSGLEPASLRAVTPESLADLLGQTTNNLVLVIDMRSPAQYSHSHIRNSVHVCVPNTLLKRASFGLEKIAESLVTEKDREALQNWKKYSNIVVCDASSEAVVDTSPIAYFTRKFTGKPSAAAVGWLKGGFGAFTARFPNMCEVNRDQPTQTLVPKPLPSPSSFLAAPLVCPTPMDNMINPFLSNIRPHHEVTCELGEIIAVRTPNAASKLNIEIPYFLSDVSYNPQGKYKLSQTFKRLDKVEQKRLQSLLIAQAHHVCKANPYSIAAGVERGSKNRYNNIWPYEHSRVRLKHPVVSDSDYINASFICGKNSEKQYIATQGPMPSTFADFWEMIWEQNSRVIVMLTKEEEAGRIKCHRYWPDPSSSSVMYGESMQVKLISEQFPLEADRTVLLRDFVLINLSTGEERKIHQLQFIGWPDFGIPADPTSVLALRDIAHDLQHSSRAGPMVVHCSAGCGRTGAFCTIDTVLESLAAKSVDTANDVIAETVDQFRDQRLSMVQTLHQFVFCYEAVLWRLMGAPGCERLDPSTSKEGVLASQSSSRRQLSLSLLSPPTSTPSGADYFAFSPSQNTTLTFNDPSRTSYFG